MKSEKGGVAVSKCLKCARRKKVIAELDAEQVCLERKLDDAEDAALAAQDEQRIQAARHERELTAERERADRIQEELESTTKTLCRIERFGLEQFKLTCDLTARCEELLQENLKLRGIENEDWEVVDDSNDDPSPSVRLMRARANVANGMS